MRIVNPTKKAVRVDKGGDGHYGAPRTKIRNGRTYHYKHKGTDFFCDPGQDVVSPVFGKIVRIAYPYADKNYGGVVIDAHWIVIKLFYMDPIENAVGRVLYPNEKIGTAQDISKKYKKYGVLPHIHLEIVRVTKDPEEYLIE